MRVCLVFVMGKPSVLTGIQSMRKSLGVGGFIARRPAQLLMPAGSCQSKLKSAGAIGLSVRQ